MQLSLGGRGWGGVRAGRLWQLREDRIQRCSVNLRGCCIHIAYICINALYVHTSASAMHTHLLRLLHWNLRLAQQPELQMFRCSSARKIVVPDLLRQITFSQTAVMVLRILPPSATPTTCCALLKIASRLSVRSLRPVLVPLSNRARYATAGAYTEDAPPTDLAHTRNIGIIAHIDAVSPQSCSGLKGTELWDPGGRIDGTLTAAPHRVKLLRQSGCSFTVVSPGE